MKQIYFLVFFLITICTNAQSYLTVADGDPSLLGNKTSFLPVWGSEMDANQHNQLIYPFGAIQPLQGAKITKIVFYSTTENENWGGANGTIKLMHTTDQVFTISEGLLDASSATQVYEGNIAIDNYAMIFSFATPFTFTGSNLLIDIDITSPGVWAYTEFCGLSSSIAFGCRDGWPIYFFTKITFEYYPDEIPTYSVTASSTSGGVIVPSGEVLVVEYENKRFDFTPNENHILSQVFIDGVENEDAVVNSYHVFYNVVKSHTIHAVFAPVTGTHYTVTATAGEGGTITSNGNVIVLENQSKRFEFKPNAYYKLSRVMIDNEENVQAAMDGFYLFVDIAANHTIYSEFEPIGGSITVNDDIKIGATIPVSTAYMDCSQHVQIIYTAELLQDLVGKSIMRIAYHASTSIETFGGARGTVRIMHTTANNLAIGFVDTSSATTIYTGPIALADFLLELKFLEPFHYTGGNLLIDITTDPGEPRNIVFYGSTAIDLARFSFTFEGVYYNQTHSFAPKTTFDYLSTPVHIIQASAGTGGFITPSGIIAVPENISKRFDFTPYTNYKLSKVLIDDAENAQALLDGYYIFSNITENHSIHVDFVFEDNIDENRYKFIHVYAYDQTLYIINERKIPIKRIEIIDLLGRRITTLFQNSLTAIDISHLQAGVYIVLLFSENSMLNRKIVVY